MLSEPPFMNPRDLARLDALEVTSVRLAEGRLPGRHRSRMKGGCAEFAEHRAYGVGDEVRRLDWRVVAKCDRYYVKQYNDESVLMATLVLDAGGGMGFAEKGPSKWDAARAVASGLTRLLLEQRDPVGLALAATPMPPLMPARSGASHYAALMDALARTVPAGPGSLAERLSEISGRIRRRGLVVVVSDAFCDLEPLAQSLRRLGSHGHQLVLVHTVAPEELSFPYRDGIRFVSLEDGGDSIPLDASSFRGTYLKRLAAHLAELRRICASVRCDYVPLRTDQSAAEVLCHYLRERAQRLRTYY
ncbi:MAG: DUF58 domain-containing protein [Verrucomicrobiaceae bacterium]|nr:MAG: DUF58 domain-containing protein [Verrucomicrobiaceae bacterium]